MPRAWVIANWKLNLPPAGIEAWVRELGSAPDRSTSVVCAPPFPFLDRLRSVAGEAGLEVGAQDCSPETTGAFTGDVSAAMLARVGARYVIVGHSERRSLRGDDDTIVARKLERVLEAGLVPVLCIGESLEVREAGGTEAHLDTQIRVAATAAGLERAARVLIAYEPIWAIGTGRNASGAMVGEARKAIDASLRKHFPSAALEVSSVVYGGSVTPDNVEEIVEDGGIDGFLVGGASLHADKFADIRDACLNLA